MTKEEFNIAIDTAIAADCNYIVTFIQLPDLIAPEAIVNPRANFELKHKYLLETYDENMNHKFASGVSMIEVVICEDEKEVANAMKKYMHCTDNAVH